MFNLKIASASCNQTGGDWPRNFANICTAIDSAFADKADLLCLEELGLSGYERGDDFFYSDNTKTRELLQFIADYAASKDPNLVISIGHPWYFADKGLPNQEERPKNPLFNRINKQFNVQTLLSGGEIVSMSAKRNLFNYERGYEERHFEEWSDVHANEYINQYGRGRDGTIIIELQGMTYPNGIVVPPKCIPFGSPVVAIGKKQAKINLTHIICEEYWVGSRFDGSSDNTNYDRDNPLAQKARNYDITVAINPNASPPVANKIDKHIELVKLATRHCNVIVHTDGLGSSGSTFAQFGSRLMAQKGQLISQGVRVSFNDIAYTSQVIEVPAAKKDKKGHVPHAIIPHEFSKKHSEPVQDGPAHWDKGQNREIEEEMRIELLWLFDYMRKNNINGITQALSGGADSAYNAAKVRLMIELAITDRGFDGFFEAMNRPSYEKAVLSVLSSTGNKEVAIDLIMGNMLTCVYMGTDNSSDETQRAAKTLIEGGTTIDGVHFKGIGGKFYYRNVQRLVDVYAEIYSGVNPSEMSDEKDTEIRKEIAHILRARKEDTPPEELERRIHLLKSTFDEITHDVLSTANDKHSVAYENLQARLRQVMIMMFSNVENKIGMANPNLDEARNSYATWGGDLHGGMIGGNAHKNKQRQLDHMHFLHTVGLDGLSPVAGFYWVLKNVPSAELQPKSKDGKVTQFDEDQLGRTFEQMDVISQYMLYDRPLDQHERKNTPSEVFEKCRKHKAFAGDSIEILHDRIRLSYEKWAHAQFKIHGSPISFTYGKNVDKQSSLRTPNIGAFHQPELAELAIYCLDLMAKRDGLLFENLKGHHSIKTCKSYALLDNNFIQAMTFKMWTPNTNDGRWRKIGTLYSHIKEHGFSQIIPTEIPKTSNRRFFQAASDYQARKQLEARGRGLTNGHHFNFASTDYSFYLACFAGASYVASPILIFAGILLLQPVITGIGIALAAGGLSVGGIAAYGLFTKTNSLRNTSEGATVPISTSVLPP